MYIGKASEVTEELYEALQRLIPQLGRDKVPPTRDELEALLKSGSATLLIARDFDEDGKIAGVLTLTIYRVPTGLRSMVEDLVVDEKMRRRGIGEALIHHAIELARAAGANGVALTSNFQREAANQFYQSLGFTRREANAYFYKLR
jgi:ribosomal protein S18 acetylase RimI-like enzyme